MHSEYCAVLTPPLILSAGVVEHPNVNTPPTVRSHGGVTATRLPPGAGPSWAPAAKRQRLSRKRRPPHLPLAGIPSGTTITDATREAPLLLGPEQKESLGKFIDSDSNLLRRVGWEKFVELKRGTKSDIHSNLRCKAEPDMVRASFRRE